MGGKTTRTKVPKSLLT